MAPYIRTVLVVLLLLYVVGIYAQSRMAACIAHCRSMGYRTAYLYGGEDGICYCVE